jgi:hypothetical protein
MYLQDFSKGAEYASRARRRIKRLGVVPSGAKLWKDEEDNLCRAHHRNTAKLVKLLPHRSTRAIRGRCQRLGLTAKRNLMTAAEVTRLRRLYPTAPISALLAAFPQRSLRSLRQLAKYYRVKRQKPSYKVTGFPIIDSIRKRCETLGYTMSDLDALVGSRRYFASAAWVQKERPSPKWIPKAIKALDGELTVTWSEL